jgi:hypothetical protein
MKLEFTGQIFEKDSDTKFYGNPSSESQVSHADGQMEGQVDVTNLIVAFRNFANALKNEFRREKCLRGKEVKGKVFRR